MFKKEQIGLYILQSAFLWAGVPILWSYLPTYMEGSGYQASQIGFLMAINPLIAILVQPFIGVYVDQAKSKNRVFILLMVGTVLATLSLPLGKDFTFVTIMIVILSFFQAALMPISESISLESVDKQGKSYAPIRMAGTIGYAVVAIIAGALMKRDLRSIFYVMAVVGLLNSLLIGLIPKVTGHQHKENKVPIRVIFKDRLLIYYNLLSIVAQILMSFFYTFMPVYFIQLGGSQQALGWVFFISAMAEVPFLLKADAIIAKFGNRTMLIISMVAISLRVLLLVFVSDPLWIFPIALFNGLSFIVFGYTLVVYVNKTMPKELKTTGQTVLAVAMGIGRIIGAFLGGLLIDRLGAKPTMTLGFILGMITIAVFFIIVENHNRKYKVRG